MFYALNYLIFLFLLLLRLQYLYHVFFAFLTSISHISIQVLNTLHDTFSLNNVDLFNECYIWITYCDMYWNFNYILFFAEHGAGQIDIIFISAFWPIIYYLPINTCYWNFLVVQMIQSPLTTCLLKTNHHNKCNILVGIVLF